MTKIYLEPRKDFDRCIKEEKENSITYYFHKTLDVLAHQFEADNKEEEELIQEALEWFWHNIEPLTNHYSIKFEYKAKPHYSISYYDKDNDIKKYHRSTVYPGKIIYWDYEIALNALNNIKKSHSQETIFHIEEHHD